MPISPTASSTTSGSVSSRTPKASSTSALPHRLETDRFPCLATVTPHPATTKAAVVEMLNVWAPSPPVPQVSTTVEAFTWMRWALRRMVRAAPASSENVSPFGGQSGHKGPDLGVGEVPGHERIHDGAHLFFRKVHPFGNLLQAVAKHVSDLRARSGSCARGAFPRAS